ncbi:uncharacterized protein LOC135475832 [Liolophura sinensis]|uniref:uncharacterized protein LOC135475832 n=1 Tax=Liolophura sinensis TaxID=3198878 RepID=UPI003158CAD0
MNTILGRGLTCITQCHCLRASLRRGFIYTIQVRQPTECSSRLIAGIQSISVRGKKLFTKQPVQFIAKHKQDKIPEAFDLVYVNNMNRYYFTSQVIIYGLLLPTLCFCIYLLWADHKSLVPRLEAEGLDHPYFVIVPTTVFSVGLLIFTNAVCRRAVIRMYRNADQKTYIAVTQRWNMIQELLEFSPKDCVPQDRESLSVRHMLGGNIQIKGRTFLLRDGDFRQPMYYNELMGWDRAEEDRRAVMDDDFSKLIRKK